MGIFSKLNEFEKRFSWSLLGVIVAVIFGSITIYVEFIKENKPDLNFVITSNSSVLDIRENLGSLDVLYQGESLSKNKKELRIISFKIINQGDASILPNFYDKNDPVGFKVKNGILADAPKLKEASNNYLREQLLIEKQNDESVKFSNVIIEEGEFFEIKVLILHNITTEPEIIPFGKVAGVTSIDLFTDFNQSSDRSFLSEAFEGDIYITTTRFVVYGLGFLLIFIGFIILAIQYDEFKEKKKKRKLIGIFKEYESDKITEKDGFFFDYYLTLGAREVSVLNDILSSQNISDEEQVNTSKYKLLVNEGFIRERGEDRLIDEARALVLSNFVGFLKRKGEFKNRFNVRLADIEAIKENGEKTHNKSLN